MKIIEQSKIKLIPHLIQWAETFNPENIIYNKYTIEEDKEEKLYKDYESILALIERLEKGECTEKDYENILFHIEQINNQEEIITL
ncbi:MAG: hypothetical protein M9958_10735 [Chitinophagales bacterium]|nr:hypothetical protein [Chitinophagales bacterium]